MDRSIDILLVDDNAADRALVRRLLPEPYTLRDAATAASAADELRTATPDLVLLDYRLPDADGTALLPVFAEHHIPVVMLTGMESAHVVVEAMQGGAQDYLVKNNLSEKTLAKAIHHAIEKATLQRTLAEQQEAISRQAELLETKNREVSALAKALTLAEQAERRRLAELLHDHLQQQLFGAKLALGALLRPDDDEKRHKQVAAVEEVLDQAISTTRDLAVELTPPVLDREELEVAMRWLAHQVESRYGLAVNISDTGTCRVQSREMRVLLVQLVRELLFNVVKHAEVLEAEIHISRDGDFDVVSVSDRGTGFDVDQQWLDAGNDAAVGGFQRGFGLFSIRERLELLGGSFNIQSSQGTGTRAVIRLPRSVGNSVRDGAEAARA